MLKVMQRMYRLPSMELLSHPLQMEWLDLAKPKIMRVINMYIIYVFHVYIYDVSVGEFDNEAKVSNFKVGLK